MGEEWDSTRKCTRSNLVPYLHQQHNWRNKNEAYLFADDMKLFSCIMDIQSNLTLQADLDRVTSSTKRWLLSLKNMQKFEVLTLGQPSGSFRYVLDMGIQNSARRD